MAIPQRPWVPTQLNSLTLTPIPFASLPAASSVPGAVYLVSDAGPAPGISLVSDGSNWLPAGGSQIILGAFGSLASPLASLTGVTAGQFTIPGGNPVIPAGLLVPGKSQLRIISHFRRVGATATATLAIRVGTAGTTGDPYIWIPTLAATNNLETWPHTVLTFDTSTTYTSSFSVVPGANGGSNFGDKSGNINTAAEMYVTFDLSAANTADTFSLISYKVELMSVPG